MKLNFFHKQPNITRLIAEYLNVRDVNKFCLAQKAHYKCVYQSNSFWRNKFNRDFPSNETKPDDWDWLKLYQAHVSTLFVFDKLDRHLIKQGVIMISCGLYHCGFITREHSLYMWGQNYRGAMGLKKDIAIKRTPTFLASNAIWLSCNGHSSLYINEQNEAYMCGLIEPSSSETIYGFTFLAANVREAHIYKFYMKRSICAILTMDFDLQILRNSDFITLDKNIKTLCTGKDFYYITRNHDLNLWNRDYNCKSKIASGVCKFEYNFYLTLADQLFFINDSHNHELISTNVIDFSATDYNVGCCFITKNKNVYITDLLYSNNFMDPTGSPLSKDIFMSLNSEQQADIILKLPNDKLRIAATKALSYVSLLTTNGKSVKVGREHVMLVKWDYPS